MKTYRFFCSIPAIILLLIAIFSSLAHGQTTTLDEAAAAKLETLTVKNKEGVTSFMPTPYPDYAVKFEEKFTTEWSKKEASFLKQIEAAKTATQVKTITTASNTDFKNLAYEIYYSLAKQADEIYEADLKRLQKLEFGSKITTDITNDLQKYLKDAKAIIQQAKEKKIGEIK